MRRQKWANPTGTRTYYAWRSMHARCRDTTPSVAANYRDRGIKVCARWASYDAFVEDMGECPTGLTLDRKHNSRGYFKMNCRWATMKEQLNNQRRNVKVTLNGRTQNVSQWAEILGVRYDTLHRRLRRMKPAKALKAGRLTLPPWEHGDRRGYTSGCRCDLCREGHNKRMRDQRVRRKAGYATLAADTFKKG